MEKKTKGIELTIGRRAQPIRLWQSFFSQPAFPWPSKTPPPDSVILSTYAKVIQLSP